MAFLIAGSVLNLLFLHRLLKLFSYLKSKYQGHNLVGRDFSIWKVRLFLESSDNLNDKTVAELKCSALKRLRLTYLFWILAGVCLLLIVAVVLSKGRGA